MRSEPPSRPVEEDFRPIPDVDRLTSHLTTRLNCNGTLNRRIAAPEAQDPLKRNPFLATLKGQVHSMDGLRSGALFFKGGGLTF